MFDLEADRDEYLAALLDVARDADVAIHCYALLPDRVLLLLTPDQGAALAPMMQRLGRRFVATYNKRRGLSGSPWAGRYRTSVLQSSLYLLDAMCHVETAAVAAALAVRPEDWHASSAAHHLGQRFDPLISDHPMFWLLGNTPFEREIAYRRLCESQDGATISARIDEATEKGWALGDAEFIEQLSASQARRLLPVRRGRPKRQANEGSVGLVSDPN